MSSRRSALTTPRRLPRGSGRLHGVPPFEGERMIRQLAGKLALPAGVAIAIPLLASPAIAASSPAPALIPDSALQAMSATVGGAKPQPSTSTLTHFFRTALNPLDNTTFGFNMVGQD